MLTRRRFIATAAAAGLAGCSGDSGGETVEEPSGLAVTSPAFAEGGSIPEEFTADGADRSPPIQVDGLPAEARQLALIADDPDAPSPPFTHWLLWAIPADRDEIPAGVPQGRLVPSLGNARQGRNDFDELGYRGPAPPAEDDAHTYRFTAYALDSAPGVEAGATRGTLREGFQDSVVASGRLTGEYDR